MRDAVDAAARRRMRWPADGELPSAAEVSLAHMRDPELTLADVERTQRESLLHRLD